jgi:hypothetical protein
MVTFGEETFVLFAPFGSVVVDDEVELVAAVPGVGEVAVIVTTADAPGARLPIVQSIPVQEPSVVVAGPVAVAPKRVLSSVTELAVNVASLFVTVIVKVKGSPL